MIDGLFLKYLRGNSVSLNLEDKKAIVAEVSGIASKAISAAAAEYRGLSVTDITKLRVEARKANVYLKVVRNTLARRAIKGTSFELAVARNPFRVCFGV